MNTSPELLAPAGGFDAALAAFQYGADAVYLGLPRFSARADADNLTPDRLRVLLAYARSFAPPKKIYVTFNTLVCEGEMDKALEALDLLADLAPDGVIVQDLGVAQLIREHFPTLALHASTQLAAHSLDGVLALKELGFTRVVLARELSCEEMRRIVQMSGVEIEVFVHGALCYSYSGLCLFSSHTAGRSGNRGRCAYCCREGFAAGDRAPTRYPFSMKDLALAPMLDAVTATGVHSLKIEGRMKSPLYVACVTDYYRRKLDRSLTPSDERKLVQDLQTIFSRPWTTLYADPALPTLPIDPLAIGHRGAPIGRTEAVLRDREGTRWVRFTSSRALEKHDGVQVELPNGGKPFGFAVNLLRAVGNTRLAITLPAGTPVEVALPPDAPTSIPHGAPVFCSASQAVRRAYPIRALREAELAIGHPADFSVTLSPEGIAVTASAPGAPSTSSANVTASAFLPCALAPSRQPDQTAPAVRKAFERLGDTAWALGALTVLDPQGCYAPPSKLNEARRAVLPALTEAYARHRADLLQRTRSCPSVAPRALPGVPPPPPAPLWTLKMRLAPLPSALGFLPPGFFDTLILALPHAPYAELAPVLAPWADRRPRLALPLISRDAERDTLRRTVARLIAEGWGDWECADLAGHHLLRALGVAPVSSDWSLYALNRVAAGALVRLGMQSFVLSPELDLATLHALARGTPAPAPELIAYQHTPLFISETAPCLPEAEAAPRLAPLTDRRNRTFITHRLDSRWVTVGERPLCLAGHLAQTGCTRFRVDLSWSPDPSPATHAEALRALRADRPLPATHAANLTRALA